MYGEPFDTMIYEWRRREAERRPDRVAFTIPRSFTHCERHPRALARVLHHVFGIPPTAIHGQPLRIICRADQFARFIIMRNDAGLQNGIKELHATLLDEPGPAPHVYDVTGYRS